jgi:hypothetical protein
MMVEVVDDVEAGEGDFVDVLEGKEGGVVITRRLVGIFCICFDLRRVRE